MAIKFFNNPENMLRLLRLMLEGVGTTCNLFVLTLVFSLPLGMLVALGRMSKRAVIRRPIALYIYIMRGTPLMLQIMFIYFLLPNILPFKVDRFSAVILAMSVNYAAYFAEIFRGGIQSIPQGQYEAGQVLGFTRTQTFFHIILPQVCKRVLLPVTNEVITLVKDTALASTVAVSELMNVAKKQVSGTSSIESYVVAMIIYLILNGVAEQVCKWVERKMNHYK